MSDIPYNNVIILENIEVQYDEIIESYIEIINRCISNNEIKTSLEMLIDEVTLLVSEQLIQKQISKQCDLLKEIKEEQFNRR